MNFGTIQVANIFVGTLNAIEAYFGTDKVWGKSEPATANWLCFTAEEANSTLHLDKVGSPNAISLETSTDGSNWTDYTWSGNTGTTLTLSNVGDKVYMRAKTENQTIGSSNSDYYKFVMTGKIASGGNIQTLLKADCSRTDAQAYCYYRLFFSCTSLTTAPRLPATTLANFCYYTMFQNCTSLTTAPELPSTTLAKNCYQEMFSGCTSLTSAPELPATTLANNCYDRMFYNCTSLTSAPELPATELAEGCYSNMFEGCTSLTSAPELPSTTLAKNCYQEMFSYCESLTTAPELPATTLAANCYNGMFIGCYSLTTAPELPATTLANNCYKEMFSYCKSLTTAPELPAATLANGCYRYMFSRCSNLNTIKLGYTGNFSGDYFVNWVSGVASTGTFYYNGIDEATGASAIPKGWVVVAPLFFTAEEANSTLHLDKVGSPNSISLETSTDGNTWTDYSWTENNGDTLTLTNVGDKVYMRAKTENKTIGSSNSDYYKFVMTGKIASGGNIQALLKADCSRTDVPAYCYKNLFNGCQSLTTTKKLPATKLYAGCYSNMFEGCTSLTTSPALHATELGAGCYKEMFKGCTSLTTAPALPATTLDNGCYSGMFYDCTSLTTAPYLPATTLTFGCYQNMFRNCTSLTTTPKLPATTLAKSCYQGLFYGCTNLNSITLDYTGNFSNNYFNYWVSGVASTGTFYYNGSDTTTGVSAIPTGWTVTPFTS